MQEGAVSVICRICLESFMIRDGTDRGAFWVFRSGPESDDL